MARMIAGIGTSHSPALNMSPEAWLTRAQVSDQTRMPLYDEAGERISYEKLLAGASPSLAEEIRPEVLERRHEANQRAIAQIENILQELRPDAIVMFGDDHREVYRDDNLPSLSIYCGETIPYIPSGILKWPYEPELKSELWYEEVNREYPIASELAGHLVTDLIERRFDVAISRYYPEGQGMSHSFAFVYWRYMRERAIPAVPVNLNTYFPPNQITPARCYELGSAIRQGIESWGEDARVLVMATGGLSHFVVDEELDRGFIDALRSRDRERITGLPRAKLNGGNSELRNWIALAGAVETLDDVELIDYVPCYRSPAGTGCAMGFVHWS